MFTNIIDVKQSLAMLTNSIGTNFANLVKFENFCYVLFYTLIAQVYSF